MASEMQHAAAEYIQATTQFTIVRTTEKAIVLKDDKRPGIRLRVGADEVWMQRRVTDGTDGGSWVDSNRLGLTTAQMAARTAGPGIGG